MEARFRLEFSRKNYTQNKKLKFSRITLSVCLSCLSIYLSIYSCYSRLEHKVSVKSFVSFQFLNVRQSIGLLGRGISPSQGRYLHRTTQTQNKHRQTSTPWVGLEFIIPVFEWAKAFHALDCVATVIGSPVIRNKKTEVGVRIKSKNSALILANTEKSKELISVNISVSLLGLRLETRNREVMCICISYIY
jgi:hypothetical protein